MNRTLGVNTESVDSKLPHIISQLKYLEEQGRTDLLDAVLGMLDDAVSRDGAEAMTYVDVQASALIVQEANMGLALVDLARRVGGWVTSATLEQLTCDVSDIANEVFPDSVASLGLSEVCEQVRKAIDTRTATQGLSTLTQAAEDCPLPEPVVLDAIYPQGDEVEPWDEALAGLVQDGLVEIEGSDQFRQPVNRVGMLLDACLRLGRACGITKDEIAGWTNSAWDVELDTAGSRQHYGTTASADVMVSILAIAQSKNTTLSRWAHKSVRKFADGADSPEPAEVRKEALAFVGV